MNKWIDYKKVLPNENATFLTICENGGYYIRKLKHLHRLINVPGIFTKAVTAAGMITETRLLYWIPLPPPPETERINT